MKLRALVVDDEAPARRRLIRMLDELGTVETVGEAEDGEQALAQINVIKPEVVFLDVQMPRVDGLSLAERYVDLPPLVFVTAFDRHAVKAFELNAVDYLLKPVRPERLAATIDRLQARRGPTRPAPVLPAANTSTRVVASSRGVIRLFEARELTRLWSSDKYTVFKADGEEHLTEEPLAAIEVRLAPLGFFRSHRGELVNLHQVRSLRFEDGIHEVELSDGQRARVSRRSLSEVKRALGLAEE